LLSATVPPPIQKLAARYMYEPEMLNFSPKDLSVETIEQFYFTVDPGRKFELLVRLLQREQPRQAIIFCRTKRGTEKIYQRLDKKFKGAATIHGDMAQGARDSVMRRFREGSVTYLVATDVIGRGIDVSGVSHIINYDIPEFCDDYVHRVGRTGRMGREGVAYTFVCPEEGYELTRIEQRINLLLKRDEISGFDSVQSAQRDSEKSANGEPTDPTPAAILRHAARPQTLSAGTLKASEGGPIAGRAMDRAAIQPKVLANRPILRERSPRAGDLISPSRGRRR
jgi:ATP-dependent RNA helicase DeaD